MSDHHGNDHAREHDRPLSGPALRAKALESLLVEKGLVDPKALDELIDTYETKVGPRNGARIVARAWVDPEFKRRLLADATAAVNSLAGFDPVEMPEFSRQDDLPLRGNRRFHRR